MLRRKDILLLYIMNDLKSADIKKKLVGYKSIPLCKAKDLKPGDRIRYMKDNEFKGGGAVKINKYPDYVVLLNVINKASWCMQLKEPSLKLWVKTLEKVASEKEDMYKIVQMYKEGKLVKKGK
jgi:hypothetical protein